jgi:hypothetical protein
VRSRSPHPTSTATARFSVSVLGPSSSAAFHASGSAPESADLSPSAGHFSIGLSPSAGHFSVGLAPSALRRSVVFVASTALRRSSFFSPSFSLRLSAGASASARFAASADRVREPLKPTVGVGNSVAAASAGSTTTIAVGASLAVLAVLAAAIVLGLLVRRNRMKSGNEYTSDEIATPLNDTLSFTEENHLISAENPLCETAEMTLFHPNEGTGTLHGFNE